MTTPTPKRADGEYPAPDVRAARDTLAPGSAGRAAPVRTPAAGAAHLDRETGPVPAVRSSLPGSVCMEPAEPGTPSPAGGELDADGSLSAGSTGRTFTIALPAGMKLLSLNDRGHWAARYRRSQALKEAAWAVAKQAKIPRLERVSVVAEYQPPDRRRRDADNPVASVKAAIDGIVLAGCLPGDDSPRYVESVTCTIGETYPRGRLVLHLTELAAGGGAA